MSRNQRIKEALRAAGVSQEKVAEAMRITQAAIGKQLNKDSEIDSIELVDAVSKLTGKPLHWLMFGEAFYDKVQTPMSDSEDPTEYWRGQVLKTKDDLIAELKGKNEDQKQLIDKLYKEIEDLKKKIK